MLYKEMGYRECGGTRKGEKELLLWARVSDRYSQINQSALSKLTSFDFTFRDRFSFPSPHQCYPFVHHHHQYCWQLHYPQRVSQKHDGGQPANDEICDCSVHNILFLQDLFENR